MDSAQGWFSKGVHNDEDEYRALARAIDSLRTAELFRPAFKRIAAVVHKASRHSVYVGRAGATIGHLLNRFYSHQRDKDARWVCPVVQVSKDKLRHEDWEGRAIRWTKYRENQGLLCCNNDVADQRGMFPHTDACLIYVVACGRASR